MRLWRVTTRDDVIRPRVPFADAVDAACEARAARFGPGFHRIPLGEVEDIAHEYVEDPWKDVVPALGARWIRMETRNESAQEAGDSAQR
jgi:hypothetical protein